MKAITPSRPIVFNDCDSLTRRMGQVGRAAPAHADFHGELHAAFHPNVSFLCKATLLRSTLSIAVAAALGIAAFPAAAHEYTSTVTGSFTHDEDVTITPSSGNGISLTQAQSYDFSVGNHQLSISGGTNGIHFDVRPGSSSPAEIVFTGDVSLTGQTKTGINVYRITNTTVDFYGKVSVSHANSGMDVNTSTNSSMIFHQGLSLTDLDFGVSTYYAAIRNQDGFTIWASDITIDNVSSSQESPFSGIESNSGIIWVSSESVGGTGRLSISRVTSNTQSTRGYYGWGGDVGADQIIISDIESKVSSAQGVHLLAGTALGGTLSIEGIKGATSAAGLYSKGYRTYQSTTAFDDTIDVKDVKAAHGVAAGVDNYGSLLSSTELTISDVTSEAAVADGTDVTAYGYRGREFTYSNTPLGAGLNVGSLDISNVTSVAGAAYGWRNDRTLAAEETDHVVEGDLSISGISGATGAYGFMASGGKSSAGTLKVKNVKTTSGVTLLVDAEAGAEITAGGAEVTSAESFTKTYRGFFAPGDAVATESEDVSTVALRSSGTGSAILMNDAAGYYKIEGAVVAGGGTEEAAGGSITLAGTLHLYGDVYAGNGGTIDLTLSAGSVLEGQIDDFYDMEEVTDAETTVFRSSAFMNASGEAVSVTKKGAATLRMAGGTWTAHGQSFVSNVVFGDAPGVIDLSETENSSVSIGKIEGSGQFRVQLSNKEDAAGKHLSDMIYVVDAGTGRQTVIVETESAVDELQGIRFATVRTGNADELFTVRLADDIGVHNNVEFEVGNEAYDEADEENAAYNGEGDGSGVYKPGDEAVDAIYADSTDEGGSRNYFILGEKAGSDTEISDAGQTIIATARGTYAAAVELDRFDVRYGDSKYSQEQNGVWMRVRHDRLATDAGVGDYDAKKTMCQVGYDFAQTLDAGKMLWGAAFDWMDADVDYYDIRGEGSTDRIALSLYGTLLQDNGAYFDLIAKAGRLSNDFEIWTPSGTKVTGDYDNWMFRVSGEVGHKLENGTGWFLEPQLQAQYVYVTGKDYRTTQTRVDQDDIDSLITRVGFRVGKALADSKHTTVYAKADVLREWMGEQKIRVFDATTVRSGADFSVQNKGTWFDVGAGFQAEVAKDAFAFADVEYRFGNDWDDSWSFNVGGRWMF